MCIVTVVTVSDAVLKHGVPLLLLLLCRHAEVVMAGIWVPQDEGELGHTLNERTTAHFGLNTCSKLRDRARIRCCKTYSYTKRVIQRQIFIILSLNFRLTTLADIIAKKNLH